MKARHQCNWVSIAHISTFLSTYFYFVLHIFLLCIECISALNFIYFHFPSNSPLSCTVWQAHLGWRGTLPSVLERVSYTGCCSCAQVLPSCPLSSSSCPRWVGAWKGSFDAMQPLPFSHLVTECQISLLRGRNCSCFHVFRAFYDSSLRLAQAACRDWGGVGKSLLACGDRQQLAGASLHSPLPGHLASPPS